MPPFCGLPPHIVAAVMSSALVFTSRRPAQGPAARFSIEEVSSPAFAMLRRMTPATLRVTEESMTRPCLRRSSGMNAMPARIAERGALALTGRPDTETEPES